MFSLNPVFVEMEAPDTRSLLELARSGDPGAFGQICRTHEARLLRHALSLCGNTSLAEELAQDTLVEAWKSLHRYNGKCLFFTWLCAILLNRYRNTLRERRPIPLSTLGGNDQDTFETHLSGLTDQGSPPDQSVQLREQADTVRACLAGLSPKFQQVIYLRFYVNDSLDEIAGALGCSVGTVKSRLFNALEKLRKMNALGHEGAGSDVRGGRL